MIWLFAYAAVGLGLGLFELRRSSATPAAKAGSLVLFLLLWPLWAPVVLLGQAPEASASPAGDSDSVAGRVSTALREARAVVSESKLDSLLPAKLVSRVCECTLTLEARQKELETAIAGEALALARHPLASPIRQQNLERLRDVQRRNQLTLLSLESLAESLRAQLLLVRHSGGPVDAISDLISELASSVDSLSAWNSLERSESWGLEPASDGATQAGDPTLRPGSQSSHSEVASASRGEPAEQTQHDAGPRTLDKPYRPLEQDPG